MSPETAEALAARVQTRRELRAGKRPDPGRLVDRSRRRDRRDPERGRAGHPARYVTNATVEDVRALFQAPLDLWSLLGPARRRHA